jgi:hypothetical protein
MVKILVFKIAASKTMVRPKPAPPNRFDREA